MRKLQTKIIVVLMAMVLTLSSITACTPKKVSVSFVVNSEIAYELQTNQNGKLELPEEPSKIGYTFDGWYLDEGIWQNEFTAQTSVKKDISVYAKFNVNTYTATFIADGVTVDTVTFTVEDAEISNVPEVPKKGGYIGAWESYSIIASDITVNAVYTVNPTGLIANEVDGTLLNGLVNNFLYDGYQSLSKYATVITDNKEVDYSKPIAVELSWKNTTNENFDEYTVYVSENEDMSNAMEYTTEECKVSLLNLKAGTKYFWKVVAGEFESIVNNFVTSKTTPRLIAVDGATNFRDLGGYSLGNGTSIPQGLIYRSAKLDNVTAEGKETIAQLGIKTEIDLRMNDANGGKDDGDESFIGEDVNYFYCPVGYAAVNESIQITEEYKQAVQKVFNILADESNYPLVFHCTAGADRTGFISYVLLSVLGVEEEKVREDYYITNFSNQNESLRTVDNIAKLINAINNENGATLSEKAQNYLVNVWGISTADIESIKEILTANEELLGWDEYSEPETYNYSVKVYKDGVDCTSEFVLPSTQAQAFTLVSISSWTSINIPDGYILDNVNSVLTQRLVSEDMVFSVYYEKNPNEEVVANITSQFNFTTAGVLTAESTWNDYGKIKYALTDFVVSNFLDVSEYQGLTLRITMPQLYGYYGLAFYTEASENEGRSNESGWVFANTDGALYSVGVFDVMIPVGAKYIRTTYFNPNGAYAQNASDYPFKAIVVKSLCTDITSLFKFSEKSVISAAKENMTGVPLGKLKLDGALGSYKATRDFIDISAYKGMTLQITLIASPYYGLVFYSEKHDNTLSLGWGGQDVAETIHYVKLVTNTEAETGSVSVITVEIPEDANYLRTTYAANTTVQFSAIILNNK